MKELKLDGAPPRELVETCHIWTDASTTPYHAKLMHFHNELELYYKRIQDFQLDGGVSDIRKQFTDPNNNNNNNDSSNNTICQQLELHPDGLPALFAQSQQLSYTDAGWVEPLIPPMRSPKFCLEGETELLNLRYLIHDFAAMCRQLKPTSRTVFVDLGASLSFHRGRVSPAIFLLELYRKFGISFDHIYAYEQKLQNPNDVFPQLPEHFQAAYHWINVGAESDPHSARNPFKLLLDNFEEDDLIIVKLDIDATVLERELVNQVLVNPRLATLIDHLYFEHHVNQLELAHHWGPAREGVQGSFILLNALRERGVAAHFWV
jgi:hypothetical protein